MLSWVGLLVAVVPAVKTGTWVFLSSNIEVDAELSRRI